MYINMRPGDNAPLHASPDCFSCIHAYIPHGTKVHAAFFDGLWYCVKWEAHSGFMPANYLSAFDPSPALWLARYGPGVLSMPQEQARIHYITNLQADLNLFFDPFEPQLPENGCFCQQTKDTLIRFQFIRGLQKNGVADPATKASLLVATQRLRQLDKGS